MKYTQSRQIKKYLVAYLQKCFAMYTEWVNSGLEVIDISNDNSPNIHEQYPFDSENYPIVVVGGAGSSQDDWGIDNLINDSYIAKRMGTQAVGYQILDNSNQVVYGVQFNEDFDIRNIDIALMQYKDIEEPLYVYLYSSGSNGPDQILASGSIKGFSKSLSSIIWGATELFPSFTLLKGAPYFVGINLAPTSYGSYYLMTDSALSKTDNSFNILGVSGSTGWTFINGTSVVSTINGPVYKILGGGMEINFSILVESKDLASTQKISELCFMYLNFLRYGKLQRESLMDFPNELRIGYNRDSNMTADGINLVSVDKGAESIRDRGNDRLFSVTLSVACYGRWSESFELPTIKEIDENINNF